MDTKYGKIKRVSQFKYLGEIIQENGIETKTNKSRCQKNGNSISAYSKH